MLHKSLKASVAPPATAQEPGVTPMHIQTIYNKFISAVYSTFAYSLARDHRWIQVNASVFVHLPENWQTGLDSGKAAPLQCFTLEVYLASGGQLVVSKDPIDSSMHYPYRDSSLSMVGFQPILLAPGGMLAVVDDGSLAPENAASQAWKGIVSSLLASKGIQLSALNPANRWILVRAWPSTTAADSDTTLGTVFFWPQALCFRTKPTSSNADDVVHNILNNRDEQSTYPGKLAPGSWFYSAKEGGFLDSLQFAEDWFKTRVEREKVAQERQRKRKEAEVAARKQAELAAPAVASPFYTRGDLQAAGGMYPTPPDGIVSQPATVPATNETVPARATHGTLLPRASMGEMMEMDDMASAFGEGAKRRPTVESRNSMQMDVSMGNDDLFGNLDEDEFGGHDITDADFSFFDEPDGDDDMLGPESSIPDIQNKAVQEDEQQASAAASIPSSDPAAQSDAQGVAELEAKDPPEGQELEAEVVIDAPSENIAVTSSDVIVTRSPLSPATVRKKLFDEVSNDSKIPRRRESQYEALPFKPSLMSADTKYSSGGAFGFAETEISNAAKRPFSKIAKVVDIRLPPRKRSRTERQVSKPRDSDESSYTSDASDSDSLSEFEALSLVPSPIKGMFFDKRIVALQDGDATSVATSPGSYLVLDDNPASGMSGSAQVSSPCSSHVTE
jgi:mediator of RNA polymerase II transcription subunit 13